MISKLLIVCPATGSIAMSELFLIATVNMVSKKFQN
jgi:hypothetical protein